MSTIDFEALNKLNDKTNETGKSKGMKFRLERFGVTAFALLLLSTEMVDDATGLTSLKGKRGLWYFDHKMALGKYSLSEVIKSLEKELLIKREGDRFYITPRGRKKASILRLHAPSKMPDKSKWNEKYYFAISDIPEGMRAQRDIFRSILKRKGFLRLQKSVFIAPFADLEELDLIRREYALEKYVHFFIAESAEVDDDSLLRQQFGLKPRKNK